jgi:hypothetical protein
MSPTPGAAGVEPDPLGLSAKQKWGLAIVLVIACVAVLGTIGWMNLRARRTPDDAWSTGHPADTFPEDFALPLPERHLVMGSSRDIGDPMSSTQHWILKLPTGSGDAWWASVRTFLRERGCNIQEFESDFLLFGKHSLRAECPSESVFASLSWRRFQDVDAEVVRTVR